MATFRCPTRQDFFHTIRQTKSTRRAKSFAAVGERDVVLLDHPLCRRGRNPRHPPGDARNCDENEGGDDDGDDSEGMLEDDDGEVGIAPYLGEKLLDAMDRTETTPELRAINTWLDDLRTRHNLPLRISDVDLSNGVALLDALYVIDASVFEEVEYGQSGFVQPYVLRELDKDGKSAERNLRVLREALGRFEWRDRDDGGRRLHSIEFARVDTWGLAGFVVLAAYVCNRADEFVRQMLAYEDWVVGSLEDVMWRGLQALGARDRPPREQSLGSGVSEGGSSVLSEEEVYWKRRAMEAERELRLERKRREDLERMVDDLEDKAEAWRNAHKGLQRTVERLKGEMDEKKGRCRVLKENNAPDAGGTVGRAVNQLRSDNAKLRRRVAELEKRAEVHEREMTRMLKDVRRRGKP